MHFTPIRKPKVGKLIAMPTVSDNTNTVEFLLNHNLLMHYLKNKHPSARHNFLATPNQNILNIHNKFLSFMNCFKREQFVG